jgi:hypothetical protein
MKRLFGVILFLLVTTSLCYATEAQVLIVGNSLFAGYCGATDGPASYLITDLGLSTYTNQAVSGTCIGSSNGLPGFSTYLSSYLPQQVYSIWGVNELRGGCSPTDTATWLSDYSTLNTDAINSGAIFVASQITPICGIGTGALGCNYGVGTVAEVSPTVQQKIAIWNALLEDLFYTIHGYMAGTYRDMSMNNTSYDDYNNYPSTCDSVHISAAGDIVLAYLMFHKSIPTRSRDWGHSGYPSITHDSFSWWVITGGSLVGGTTDSITGNIKGGTLTLGSSDSAVSPVLSILPNANTISITLTGTGSPTIYYRTSASNFTRTSGGEWTTYTTPFSLTAGTVAFIQIKIAGTSSTTLATLNWSGTATYTISGTVSGAVQSGVTVACTGQTSTTTAGDGTYSFTGLSAGSYTLTPSKTGYTFSPANISATISTGNLTGENFTASSTASTPSYVLSGGVVKK